MSPLYRAPRTSMTALPDAISDLGASVSALSASTSGQINGTSARLKKAIDDVAEQIRLTPQIYALHAEKLAFAPSVGATVVSTTMDTPAGKTWAQVFASLSGFCASDGIRANTPSLGFDIQGVRSRGRPTVPDNMSTYWLTGSFSRGFQVTPGQAVTVSVVCIGGTFPVPDGNWLDLDTFFAFTG